MAHVNRIAYNERASWAQLTVNLAVSLVARVRALEKQRRVSNQNQAALAKILESQHEIKLELGAGTKKGVNGWTTIDLAEGCDLALNLIKPLPFPDNSVSMIYASHLLEHFAYHDLMRLLAECHRVLMPTGCLSVVVPNARIYLEGYCSPNEFDMEFYCRYKPALNYHSKIDFVNYMAYMNGHHKHMFDEQHLLAILRSMKFDQVRLREFDPTIDNEERAYESIYADAAK